MTKDGTSILAGAPVTATNLRKELAALSRSSSTKAVVVKMQEGGSYDAIAAAVSAAQEAGLKVGFILGKPNE